jgi:FkbM family methyltransferase
MLVFAKRFVKKMFAAIGYEIRRTDEVGSNAIGDMSGLVSLNGTPNGAIIFDVGANIGGTIREFHNQFAGPIIHAFEPSPETFQSLKTNVASIPSVTLNNLGLGSSIGQLTFHENKLADMSSFLESDKDCWGESKRDVNVLIGTVDDYCFKNRIERIDVLKSDTQGYDLEVLRGADRMLTSGCVYLVYLEIIFSEMYKGRPDLDEIYRHLRDRGFRLVRFYGFNFQNGRAGWADALFACEKFSPGSRSNPL